VEARSGRGRETEADKAAVATSVSLCLLQGLLNAIERQTARAELPGASADYLLIRNSDLVPLLVLLFAIEDECVELLWLMIEQCCVSVLLQYGGRRTFRLLHVKVNRTLI